MAVVVDGAVLLAAAGGLGTMASGGFVWLRNHLTKKADEVEALKIEQATMRADLNSLRDEYQRILPAVESTEATVQHMQLTLVEMQTRQSMRAEGLEKRIVDALKATIAEEIRNSR